MIMAGDSAFRTQALPQAPAQPIQSPPESPSKPITLWIVVGAVIVAAGTAIWMWKRPEVPKPVPQIPGMVYIPADTFLAGADNIRTPLRAFYIDETEVSNQEFCRVMACSVAPGTEQLPVVNIKASEARAYAKQVGKRLPLRLEWERAVRGTNGALFPWGNQSDASRANVADNPAASHQAMPVRSFAGPIYNLIGNVWEMIEEPVTPSEEALKRFPAAAHEPWITSRGGSYRSPMNPGFSYDKVSSPESYSAPDLGFRCVKDP
jgi:formylglycine-generating enzyme required for sulfatase activity